MAKFIAIQSTDYQEVNKSFFDKFTTSNLKKTLKCKKVMQLKHSAKSKVKVAEFSDVAEYKLNQLNCLMKKLIISFIQLKQFNLQMT